MKKIVFFNVHMGYGGMEKSLLILLNKLVTDYDITLFLEEKKGELLKELNPNIKVIELKTSKSKIIVIRKIVNFINRLTFILKYKNKYDFSCSYATYSLRCSVLARQASKNNLLYMHSDYLNYYKGDVEKAKNFFDSIGLVNFNKIAFVSTESRNKAAEIFTEKSNDLIVLNNLFDIDFFKNANIRKIEKNNDDKILLFIGRLEEHSKKISRLLEVTKKIKEKKLPYKVWIVGDGPDRKLYEEMIVKYNIQDYVIMFGSQSNTFDYLFSCDYFILTSDYEGFPVVYLEAIYFKKPIITPICVRDEYINIRDYANIVEKDVDSILKGILEIDTKIIEYNYDFEIVNEKKLLKVKNLIEKK